MYALKRERINLKGVGKQTKMKVCRVVDRPVFEKWYELWVLSK